MAAIAATDTPHEQKDIHGGIGGETITAHLRSASGLEGIVSKRIDSAYRSGPTREWLKTKTAAWRAANTDRFELLHRKRA